jgi:phage gp29-like protein
MKKLNKGSMPKSLYRQSAVDEQIERLLTQMPDPDQTLLKAGLKRTDLRALESDDEIAAAIETRRESLIATPWRLEPGTGRAVNFIWEQLDAHLPNVLRTAFNAVLYGYSVQEVIYKKLDNGRIGIGSVVEKPFEWFEPLNTGELVYRNNYDMEGVYVDTRYKFLLAKRNTTYRNPYGESLLAKLYWPWLFRVNGWKFWVKALERTGTPFLKGTAPDRNDIDGTPYTELLNTVLQQAVQNAVLALPEGWDAEFMSAAQTQSSFEQFESAVTKRIQKLILGQTLTSDVTGNGSYAAAKVHDNVRTDRRNADIRLATQVVQNLINALHQLNGFSGMPPTIVIDDGQGLETERAERDAKLVQAGILTLTPDYLLRAYDFEPDDFTVPEQMTTLPGTLESFSFAAEQKFTPDQQAIEDLADALPKFSPIKKAAIESAIKAATSPEDLEQRLAVVLEKTDLTEFSRVLEQALWAADIIGYVHASED